MEASLLTLLTCPDTPYKQLQCKYLEVGYGNNTSISSSIQSIKIVLSDPKYKIESKLRTVRYLKDCFLQGNKQFVLEVEAEILPVLRKILQDRYNERSYSNYAAKKYESVEEIKQFKSELMSMFQLIQECVVNWCKWLSNHNNGRNKFVDLFKTMKQQKLIKQSKNFYFKHEDKIMFDQYWQNPNANRPPPKQIDNILKRIDNLAQLPKQTCKKEIISLTNEFEHVGKSLNPSLKQSIQKQFQARLVRASINKNSKAIDEVNQIESEHQLTVIYESDTCFELQVDSVLNANSTNHTFSNKVNNASHDSIKQNKQNQAPRLLHKASYQIFIKKPSNKQNLVSTYKRSQSVVVEPKFSQISLWNQILKSKLSDDNINNFKLALLKQNKLLYQDRKISIYFTLQNLSQKEQVYKLRFQYILSSQLSTFRWIDNVHQQGIYSSQVVQFSSQQYKQLITIKSHPKPQLCFWKVEVDGQTIQFPIPFTVLNTLLKGLVSKDRVNSCIRPQQIYSPIINLNPKFIEKSEQIYKYFANGVQGKTARGLDCLTSCLLHQFSNTMIVLNIQFHQKRKVSFKINLLEANKEQIAHSLLQILVFVFQEK